MKTVSVVIPTYKDRGGLVNCIDSVLNQGYEGLIEVIVVDDNDPNSIYRKQTEQVMHAYDNNPKVIYLRHLKNINGSAARNTGIRASKGEFVAFLDDDDIYLKDKLAKQVSYLENNPQKDAVYCFSSKINSVVREKVFENDATRDILLMQSNFQTSTLVFRRGILEKLHGFDESFIRHQDYELMLRFFHNGFSLGCVPEQLVVIGRNAGENIPKGKKLEEIKTYFFSVFKSFIDEENRKTPGFANEVYARHYAFVFLSHIKNFYWGKAVKIFFKYFTKSPIVFFRIVLNSFLIHIKGKY